MIMAVAVCELRELRELRASWAARGVKGQARLVELGVGMKEGAMMTTGGRRETHL
jgi:hypothetical protein